MSHEALSPEKRLETSLKIIAATLLDVVGGATTTVGVLGVLSVLASQNSLLFHNPEVVLNAYPGIDALMTALFGSSLVTAGFRLVRR